MAVNHSDAEGPLWMPRKREEPISVETAYLNESGELVITLTDATEINVGSVMGLHGSMGPRGMP
jgi:hypothetical protein